MRATFGDFNITTVIDGEEDVGRSREIWEGFSEGKGVGGLHKHEGHGRAKKDNVGVLVL